MSDKIEAKRMDRALICIFLNEIDRNPVHLCKRVEKTIAKTVDFLMSLSKLPEMASRSTISYEKKRNKEPIFDFNLAAIKEFLDTGGYRGLFKRNGTLDNLSKGVLSFTKDFILASLIKRCEISHQELEETKKPVGSTYAVRDVNGKRYSFFILAHTARKTIIEPEVIEKCILRIEKVSKNGEYAALVIPEVNTKTHRALIDNISSRVNVWLIDRKGNFTVETCKG